MKTLGDRMPLADIIKRTPLPTYHDIADSGLVPLAFNIDSTMCNPAACVVSNVVDYLRVCHGLIRVRPSIMAIGYNARVLVGENQPHSDVGVTLGQACDAVRRFGVCPDEHWPFNLATYAVRPPVQSVPWLLCAAPVRIEDIKATLLFSGPVMFTMEAYESFESLAAAKAKIVPVPVGCEALLGSYAMLITGFCDTLQAFLCQDSSSTFFGPEGRCAIPYEYVLDPSIATDFWCLQLYKR